MCDSTAIIRCAITSTIGSERPDPSHKIQIVGNNFDIVAVKKGWDGCKIVQLSVTDVPDTSSLLNVSHNTIRYTMNSSASTGALQTILIFGNLIQNIAITTDLKVFVATHNTVTTRFLALDNKPATFLLPSQSTPLPIMRMMSFELVTHTSSPNVISWEGCPNYLVAQQGMNALGEIDQVNIQTTKQAFQYNTNDSTAILSGCREETSTRTVPKSKSHTHERTPTLIPIPITHTATMSKAPTHSLPPSLSNTHNTNTGRPTSSVTSTTTAATTLTPPASSSPSLYRDTLSNTGSVTLMPIPTTTCLLYTSDAADEEDSVDLGGRRIIKKKKNNKKSHHKKD
eukprot:TRINITY_DN30424_c0_g1_i1.p1 TRINITY_DN30424_c0_g1~~TRINITY_DN30424_c0_g1_i1.p1  ORF type:complete len:341 (+),score=49.53 TRINITY_DN30424_c0_g1_i1:128-1150(+)